MKIERIELCNFGSYEDVNSFDFVSNDTSKRIVIIGGKNGAGKTTLFTAIQICLYGHASFGFKTQGKRYLKEIYNLINNKARLDESKKAYIRIWFSESNINTDHYVVTRSWTWSNRIVCEDYAVLQNGIELDAEAAFNFQNYLLHLIPPELHKLYFFDGENIADYFLDEHHNNVKEALLVLSGNDTYEILYNNVRRLLNGVESDNESIAQNYADQKEVYAKFCAKEAAFLLEQQETISNIEHCESELRKENEQYTADGGVTLEEWKNLQQSLKDEEARREQLSRNLKDFAANILPFFILKDILVDVREQINLEKELQTYKVLKDSLSAPKFKRCVSNAVKKTTSVENAIDTNVILHAIQTFFENRTLEFQKPIFKLSEDESISILNKISFVERFDASIVKNNKDRIKESLQRSAELRELIQKSSIENFESHVRNVSMISTQLEKEKRQLENINNELSTLQNEIEKLRKTLEASRKDLEAELKKKSVSALSDRVLLLVEELQTQQHKKLIADVERDLTRKFTELIRKDNFVDNIYLDQDFSLHLVRNQEVELSALKLTAKKHGISALKGSIKQTGFTSLLEQLHTSEDGLVFALEKYPKETILLPVELDHNRFSNGEKQVLVMSLYWAIMNQSPNDLPFIIDTPFARIDTEHRANITERFFKELRGQLVVLSTNEELRHEHIISLEKQVANIYMLEYGDDKRTKISEGSYFEVE